MIKKTIMLLYFGLCAVVPAMAVAKANALSSDYHHGHQLQYSSAADGQPQHSSQPAKAALHRLPLLTFQVGTDYFAVSNKQIIHACKTTAHGGFAIAIELNKDRADLLHRLSSKNIGQTMKIIYKKETISDAIIQTPIPARFVLTFNQYHVASYKSLLHAFSGKSCH